MNEGRFWNRIMLAGSGIILIFGLLFAWIGNQNLQKLIYDESYANVSATSITSNLDPGIMVEQQFVTHADYISGIMFRLATYNNTLKDGNIVFTFMDSQKNVLASEEIPVIDFVDSEDHQILFSEEIKVQRGASYSFEVSEVGNTDGVPATLWMGDQQKDCTLLVGGKEITNTLRFVVVSRRDGHFWTLFLISVLCLEAVLIGFSVFQKNREAKGQRTGTSEFVHIFDSHGYLLSKLVGRDFAIKYRRSYLGIIWVVLNPLLTMIVLSAVFSFVFRFTIENFPVYLILGQIFFNFYNEATQVAISSITGSGQMIKKIYIPKYIFPLSKTMFSFVNFVLTFIPVWLVMIYYKIPITINIVYLPVLMAAFFAFVLGMAFILSTMQVFMRDVQYLYGIFVTVLGYLTPIFYPITSLSPRLQKIMLLNPLFHYINTARTILLYGNTPTVNQMMACIFIGIVFLAIGIQYFYKRQKRFILFI